MVALPANEAAAPACEAGTAPGAEVVTRPPIPTTVTVNNSDMCAILILSTSILLAGPACIFLADSHFNCLLMDISL
ncbi:hypothetical protein AB0C44_06645 [Micromonospora taraxaci]|uniref:hypothetical protein n=1 Tax=Micromonospora taraxaci TaxID=1316803 RepID=UPI0033DC2301